MKTTLSINDVLDRYNSAFGFPAMKIAPRIIQLAGGYKNVLLSNIGQFTDVDSSFAETIFKSNKTGKEYSFGVAGSAGSQAAFPFQKSSTGGEQKYLAPPVMIRPRRGKNVVRTPIDRSEFEVIEYFGLKPWDVEISGILVDMDEHLYPSGLIRTAREMFETPGTFSVSGDMWEDLGITELFFEQDFELTFVEGYVDTVKFSVKAISTSPVNFLLNGY